MSIAVASTSEAPVMVTLHSELQAAPLIFLHTWCSEAKPYSFLDNSCNRNRRGSSVQDRTFSMHDGCIPGDWQKCVRLANLTSVNTLFLRCCRRHVRQMRN